MSFRKEEKYPAMRPQIILFGDDKTEEGFRLDAGGGWAAGLAEIYSRKADIIVRGFKGYTTKQAVRTLENHDISTKSTTPPAATVVSFGANDGRTTAQQYKSNIENIVSLLKDECYPKIPDTLVVLLTPLPLFGKALIRFYGGSGDDPDEKIYGLLMREQADMTERFADMCNDVAFKLDIPCVDVWGGMHTYENWQQEYFCDDGLHLSRKGNRFVCDAVAEVLSDNGLCPSTMKIDLVLAESPQIL